MSEVQVDGDRSPESSRTSPARGLHPDPDRVITQTEKFGKICWTRSDYPRFRVSHLQHLLVMQGLPLSQLVAPHALMLRANPPPIWRVPYELRDVVLATIHSMEVDDAPLEEVALELMRVVYST